MESPRLEKTSKTFKECGKADLRSRHYPTLPPGTCWMFSINQIHTLIEGLRWFSSTIPDPDLLAGHGCSELSTSPAPSVEFGDLLRFSRQSSHSV